MELNEKVRVRSNHPFHANKVGYFKFMGGPNGDIVVLADFPTDDYNGVQLFCVGLEDLEDRGSVWVCTIRGLYSKRSDTVNIFRDRKDAYKYACTKLYSDNSLRDDEIQLYRSGEFEKCYHTCMYDYSPNEVTDSSIIKIHKCKIE